ncbi:MAG TPA: hypothetical protein PLQ93_06650 [Bacteroidia bacterium]|nr:hypothetical protein [Bacteroidia bacterium]
MSALFAVLETGVSISLFLSPQAMLENVDFKAKGVDYLVFLWATRQLALGIIFAFAAFKRSVPMLKVAYLFLLIMFLGDLFIGIRQNESSLIVSAIIMSGLSAFVLYSLNRFEKSLKHQNNHTHNI